MSEVKVCLTTQCSDLVFREYLLKKWSEGVFVCGRLVDGSLIELYADGVLDDLQMREFEVFHCMLESFVGDYFDLFVSDLIDTIIHEYMHYFARSLSEKQVTAISALISKVKTSEEADPADSNIIIVN